jgi:ATP-grasp domain
VRSTEPVTARIDRLRRALDGRSLFWFGIRGEDAEPLLAVPEFAGCFAIAAPLHRASIKGDRNITLEELTRIRVDLDRYDIDEDSSEEAQMFRTMLMRAVSTRCVLATYRPAAFVSALSFGMGETMTLAGQFKDRQRAFEHKPWVETSLKRYGVRTLDWTYVPDGQAPQAKRLLNGRPIVLRVSRASGGVGIVQARTPEEVDEGWPSQADAFVGVAPYLEDAVPLNFSGCVFRDGAVRLHPPSFQLIGIRGCTSLRFGYCGNDFAAVSRLDDSILDELDRMGRTVGAWLHQERYSGVFGVDALLHDGQTYFLEVNPRFQGSSRMSAKVAAELDVPDLFIDHVSAYLGVDPAGTAPTLREWARHQAAVSHLVIHNTSEETLWRSPRSDLPDTGEGSSLSQWPRDVGIEPGGVLCRVALNRQITTTGSEVDAGTAELVEALRSVFAAAPLWVEAGGLV